MNDIFTKYKNQKIIFCVLNWGLGHASRSVSLIDTLLNNGNEIVLVSSGDAKKFLNDKFPKLIIESAPDYKISYGNNSFLTQLNLVFQIPKVLKKIKKEQSVISSLVKKHDASILFSDSCYGAFNKNIKTYFITHQITIKSKLINRIINYFNFNKLSNFDEIIVPDYPNHLLSGDLSKVKYPFQQSLNVNFIGPLSRFKIGDLKQPYPIIEDFYFAIVSGPEPQKSNFLKLLIHKYSGSKTILKIAVGGKVVNVDSIPSNIHITNNMNDDDFIYNIISSKKIISRSGYSTIMDLYGLDSLEKVVFFPTVGQTEQEYLAQFHNKKSHR